MSHTPGPWRVEHTSTCGSRIVHGESSVKGFADDVPFGCFDSAAPGNLHLAAAAPELVAELILIHQQVTNGRLCYFGDHTGYTPQIGSEQTDRWKVLIAKATGGER